MSYLYERTLFRGKTKLGSFYLTHQINVREVFSCTGYKGAVIKGTSILHEPTFSWSYLPSKTSLSAARSRNKRMGWIIIQGLKWSMQFYMYIVHGKLLCKTCTNYPIDLASHQVSSVIKCDINK